MYYLLIKLYFDIILRENLGFNIEFIKQCVVYINNYYI